MVGIDGNYQDIGWWTWSCGIIGTNGIHGIMAWKVLENDINHIDNLMRPMELVTQIDLTELFEPEDNGKDTINWNETKQIGGITGESCCNCNYRQSWICLPFVYIFPVCAAWLGEMTTLWSMSCSWTIKLMALMKLIKLLELEEPMKLMEKKGGSDLIGGTEGVEII